MKCRLSPSQPGNFTPPWLSASQPGNFTPALGISQLELQYYNFNPIPGSLVSKYETNI